jgi:predicted mannosyl-3-phosphoglycerate phosphatase (HAD superfamily)
MYRARRYARLKIVRRELLYLWVIWLVMRDQIQQGLRGNKHTMPLRSIHEMNRSLNRPSSAAVDEIAVAARVRTSGVERVIMARRYIQRDSCDGKDVTSDRAC